MEVDQHLLERIRSLTSPRQAEVVRLVDELEQADRREVEPHPRRSLIGRCLGADRGLTPEEFKRLRREMWEGLAEAMEPF